MSEDPNIKAEAISSDLVPEICRSLVECSGFGNLVHIAERVGKLEGKPGSPRGLPALIHDADGVAVSVDGCKNAVFVPLMQFECLQTENRVYLPAVRWSSMEGQHTALIFLSALR